MGMFRRVIILRIMAKSNASNMSDSELFWELDRELRYNGKVEMIGSTFSVTNRRGEPFFGAELQGAVRSMVEGRAINQIFEVPQ